MRWLAWLMGICAVAFSSFAFCQGTSFRDLGTDATKLKARTQGMDVSVILSTRSIRTKALLGERFVEGQYPEIVRTVTELKIFVEGQRLFVPRSTFADLVDVRKADITFVARRGVLRIQGGDASEAFEVKIEFDKSAVRRRALFDSMNPKTPLQETNYYLRVLADRP